MHDDRRTRVWAAAQIAGVVTLAYRAGDHATLIEVGEDAQVVRVQRAQRTPEGWVITADQQLDTLCSLEVIDELPLLGDRPGPAKCGFGPSSRRQSGELPAVVDAETEAA